MITTPHTRPFKYPIIQEYAAMGLDPTKIEALYLFDPAGNLYDASGNEHHGDITNSSGFGGIGRYGMGGIFDGTDDRIPIGNYAPAGNSATELSVLVWCRKISGAGIPLITHGNGVDKGGWFIDYGVGAPGDAPKQIDIFVTNSDWTLYRQYRLVTTAPLSTWHQIGFTFNAGSFKGYVNGQESAITAINDDAVNTINNPNLNIHLGCSLDALDVPTGFFSGYIDGTIIYSKELTPNQINNLYNKGL